MKLFSAVLALGLVSTLQAQSVSISIGVREPDASGGGTFVGVGADGGLSGSIEWINLDGQTLVLDGTWQPFFFDFTNDVASGFAGGTANGVLEGRFGTLEHIRILNSSGVTDPMTIWIDDIDNTTTPAGGGSTTVVFGDFEGYSEGDEVMFQEPPFSGSTAGNLVNTTLSTVDFSTAFSGAASYRADLQFIDNDPTKWCRLTTFNNGALTAPQTNPQVVFEDNGTMLFWLRGVTCPAASIGLDIACPAGPHSAGGPTMGFTGAPVLGGEFSVDATNLLSTLTALLIGAPLPTPADLSLIGGIPGALLCVTPFLDIAVAPAATASQSLPVSADPALCGFGLTFQWFDLDTSAGVGLPLGTSESLSIVVGL